MAFSEPDIVDLEIEERAGESVPRFHSPGRARAFLGRLRSGLTDLGRAARSKGRSPLLRGLLLLSFLVLGFVLALVVIVLAIPLALLGLLFGGFAVGASTAGGPASSHSPILRDGSNRFGDQ